MKVLGFAGYSGSGKTTLIEQLIPLLRAQGLRVAVLKHAHHRFDIDHEGKDSWRHRQAGAAEVIVASDRRMALMREFEQPHRLCVHALLAQIDARMDWVLVEGFKDSDLPKIEVWRAPTPDHRGGPVLYPHDGRVVAVASDAPALPEPTQLPRLHPGEPHAIVRWMLAQGARFDYARPAEETCE